MSCLQSQKRLLLALSGCGGFSLGSDRFGLGSLREVGGLDLGSAHGLRGTRLDFGGNWSGTVAAADVVLSLAAVFVGVLLD